MNQTDPHLTDSIDVGPGVDLDAWRLAVPGRAACYLLEDGDGRPIVAATVADLRGALVRRLGPDHDTAPGEQTHRKIDYRAVTRRVRWRPVFSRFEGNWTYLELVRDRFSGGYRKLIRHWRAWWVAVDPNDPHPRFDVKDKPYGPPDTCFGPFPTQKAARRRVETLEDLFDLCRYHHILAQAPHGQACAYKQMGRCPAPCDGTIPMDAYRTQIAAAIRFVRSESERTAWRDDVTAKMKQAAGERAFEQAARFKSMLDTSRDADSGGAAGAAFVRPLTGFRFVSLQRGDRKGRVRVFVIDGGAVEYAGQIEKANRDELLPKLAERIEAMRRSPIETDLPGVERIGLVAWHLLGGKRERGLFIGADALPDADAVGAAIDAFNAGPTDPSPDEAADVDDVSSEENLPAESASDNR